MLELLTLLVALSGDPHGVALARRSDGEPDRRAAVGLHLDAAPLGDPLQDLVDDCPRLLRARVVRGDHAEVEQLGANPPHPRALLPVPVTAAAEHADQPAARDPARG